MSDFDTKPMILFQQRNQNFNLGLFSFNAANIVTPSQNPPKQQQKNPPKPNPQNPQYKVTCLSDAEKNGRLSLT